MNSKERVRAALTHKQPDRVPNNLYAVTNVMNKLREHYHLETDDEVYDKFDVDIRYVYPDYVGPKLKSYVDTDGLLVDQDYWGHTRKWYWNGFDYNPINLDYPLDSCTTIEEIDAYNWPRTEWFDYESIKYQCDKYEGRAICIGDAGTYQYATFLRSAEKMYMDMILDPEIIQHIFDKFVDFELEHYQKIMEAADGRVDILRCFDDYGTQTSMLFSLDTWKQFFMENTRRLVNLAHKNGAFYMQHSCGAVRPIIPLLIECGVDCLDPIQKCVGMEPEGLKKDFGDKICFHGGIDTQYILPMGTPDDVRREVRHFVDVLNHDGGYIMTSSQSFQMDTPVENIEAVFEMFM